MALVRLLHRQRQWSLTLQLVSGLTAFFVWSRTITRPCKGLCGLNSDLLTVFFFLRVFCLTAEFLHLIPYVVLYKESTVQDSETC